MPTIERPLDLLQNLKGKQALVKLKGDKEFSGQLLAFDIHINLVIDNAKELENGEVKKSVGIVFLRGDVIESISPAKE